MAGQVASTNDSFQRKKNLRLKTGENLCQDNKRDKLQITGKLWRRHNFRGETINKMYRKGKDTLGKTT